MCFTEICYTLNIFLYADNNIVKTERGMYMSFDFDFDKLGKRDPGYFEDLDHSFDDRDFEDYEFEGEDDDIDIYGE